MVNRCYMFKSYRLYAVLLLQFLWIISSLHAQNLIRGEYFFNTDPGVGKGISFEIPASDSVNINIDVSTATLPIGFNKLFVRSINVDNTWSLYEGRNIFIYQNTALSNYNLIDAEYFIDTDPGIGKGIKTSAIFSADSIIISDSIDTESLSVGFHELFVRVKSSENIWSLYSGGNFYIAPILSKIEAPKIAAVEYFWETDKGVTASNVKYLEASDSTFLVDSVALSGQSAGFKRFFVRVMDNNKVWSHYEGRNLFIAEKSIQNDSLIVEGEYFFDTDPGVAKGISFDVTDSSEITWNLNIETSSLAIGEHKLMFRLKSKQGAWSLYQGGNVNMQLCDAIAKATKPIGPGIVDINTIDSSIFKTRKLVYKNFIPSYFWYLNPLNAGEIKIKDTTLIVRWNKDYEGPATISVKGINSCSQGETSDTLNVKVLPLAPLLDITTIPTDQGLANGSATVSITGGKKPFQIIWSNGDRTSTADSLYAGIHLLTVIDANGSRVIKPIMIHDKGAASITTVEVISNTCFGDSKGSIKINVSGGVQPYKYEWSNGAASRDLLNLPSGPYEVMVLDAEGRKSFSRFEILQPKKLRHIVQLTQATCGKSDGSAEVFVTGGEKPYSYNWSNGSKVSYLNQLSIGNYKVLISDANACKDSSLVQISNFELLLDSINESFCGTSNGAIYTSIAGGNPPYKYEWSNGFQNANQLNVAAGIYSVAVTDKSGCKAYKSIQVKQKLPLEQPVCMVFVDSSVRKNVIVFEKAQLVGVARYNIYKETTQSNVFHKIGSIPASEKSVFVDTLSNTRRRSWRYRVTAVDECGNESKPSKPHKSIHLNVNLGVLGSDTVYNLIWDSYEGFNDAPAADSYVIKRFTKSQGWHVLDTLPGTLFMYTDDGRIAGLTYYQIEVLSNKSCNPSLLKIKEGPYSSSISNLEDNRLKSGDEVAVPDFISLPSIQLFPNPASQVLNVIIDNKEFKSGSLSVYGLTGQLLKEFELTEKSYHHVFDLNNFSPGLFIVTVRLDGVMQHFKLRIQ